MRNWLFLIILFSTTTNAALIQYESLLHFEPDDYSYNGGWATSRYTVDSETGLITKMQLQAFRYNDTPWFSVDIDNPISLLGGRMGTDGYWEKHWSFWTELVQTSDGDIFQMAWEFFAPVGNPLEQMDGVGDAAVERYVRANGEQFSFANERTSKVPEPAALTLFLLGLVGVALRNLRKATVGRHGSEMHA